MAVLTGAVLVLAAAFAVHLALWRVALPRRHTRALLLVFALVPPIALCGWWIAGRQPEYSAAELVRIALFYAAFALAYIVIYSAIENESPTLAIISHVANAGAGGSGDDELSERFGRGAVMSSRFALMEHSGWLRYDGDRTLLTPQGRKVARLFDVAGRTFGITKGG